MYGPFQQMYIDMVDGASNQNVVELIGNLDELYLSTNELMAQIGAYGEVDPTGQLCDRVMNALFELDHGQVLKGGNS